MKKHKEGRYVAPAILNLGIWWWKVNFTTRSLLARGRTLILTEYETGLGPEPVWKFLENSLLSLPGFDRRIAQPNRNSTWPNDNNWRPTVTAQQAVGADRRQLLRKF
jgi:hypothetical protein